MKLSNTRVERSRWKAFGKLAAVAGVAAIVGLTAVSPAKADYYDWQYRNHWRDRHHYAVGLSFSSPGYYYGYPSYGYYSYPSYGYAYSYPSYSYPSYGYYSYGYYGGSDGYSYDYGSR